MALFLEARGAPSPDEASTRSELARLVERVGQGCPAAKDELVARFGGYLRQVVRRKLDARLRTRFDSLDFVQDVWLSLFETVESGSICTVADLQAYLTRMALNKVIDQRRRGQSRAKQYRRPDVPLEDVEGVALGLLSKEDTASQVAMAEEAYERMRKQIPTRYLRILELRQQGLMFTEIAERLGTNERTVRRVLEKLSPYGRPAAC